MPWSKKERLNQWRTGGQSKDLEIRWREEKKQVDEGQRKTSGNQTTQPKHSLETWAELWAKSLPHTCPPPGF